MPLLTKKFTRDSLKRATGNESEDPSKAEIIQADMARARRTSMRSRSALPQQQRHRSLSRGRTTPYRSFGLGDVNSKTNNVDRDGSGPTVPRFSHPNDEYGHAFNEAEILTQMSSLTEPTWAPSVGGGNDISAHHHRQNQQNQRSRTQNYNNNGRYQTRFQYGNPREHQNRATVTTSTSKDKNGTKVLHLHDKNNNSGNSVNRKSSSNHGHHERASVGEEGIEIHRIGQNEGREDDDDEKDARTLASIDRIPTLHTRNSELRDDVSFDHTAPYTPKTATSSANTRRSKSRRGRGDESSLSRARGRSGRPSSSRKSKNRSSSVSSRRSTQSTRTTSTAPTISKHSSTSTSNSKSKSKSKSTSSSSSSTKKSKADIPITASRRRTANAVQMSDAIRSSSVPPTTSNSKRNQRTSSLPPNEMRDNDTHIDRYINNDENIHCSKTDYVSDNDAIYAILDTSSTMADPAIPKMPQMSASFATASSKSNTLLDECPPTPSSVVEAARMSLRPKLRRSNSNRSVTSTQSESINSTTTSRYRRTVSSERVEKSRLSPCVTPLSPSNTGMYTSRTHKLAQDTRARKIHKQKQQLRQEQEIEQQRQQQRKEEKRQKRAAAGAARSIVISNNAEEPQHTTVATLLYDFLLFNLVFLFSLPRYAMSGLWCQVFSKKWIARHKTVLVTGASSPLGSETARQFATEGANLVLISHTTTSSEDDLDWLVEECHELGSSKVRSYTADLSNAVSAELTLRQAARDFNDTFDVVVLNGENKSHGCLFEEILDANHIEKMIKENTLGCILALHHALKHVPKTSDSRIVILSSTSGMVASPYKSVYGATQHALKGFCDSIRMELNDTYTDRRAPKVCLASFPDLVGQYTHHRDNADCCVSRMGAVKAPTKTRSWAGIPLQHAVHDLLRAVASGKRDFGAPQYVNAWRCFRVLAPDWADFSVFRHVRKTQYRPVEAVDHDNIIRRDGRKGDKGDIVSVTNKTWA